MGIQNKINMEEAAKITKKSFKDMPAKKQKELKVKSKKQQKLQQKLKTWEPNKPVEEEEDKEILTDEIKNLKKIILDQIESKITEILEKIEEVGKEIKAAKTDVDKKKLKKKKKNLVEKLNKYKKAQTNKQEIKYRIAKLMKDNAEKTKKEKNKNAERDDLGLVEDIDNEEVEKARSLLKD